MKPKLTVHENLRLRIVEIVNMHGTRRARTSLTASGVLKRTETTHFDASLDDEPIDDYMRRKALRLLADHWGLKISIRGRR